ncbi:proline hydroxylase [Polaribacter pacificus]|uniref:Proline hydroxylase n=1 Tax=Polaribacter pacificus TaxID=1775173 RepID=A0A917HUA6_9FLAO|nr:proline hydroxylase [Polaribacter pacificus]
MQEHFEQLISGFLEKQVGVSNEFLNGELAAQLKNNLKILYESEALHLAGVGNDHLYNKNKEIRRDKIFWLEKKSANLYEQTFFKLIDAFVLYLNSTCFTSIHSYEFHYALYEQGAFYKKHIDQFKSDDRRVFSMIMYLNEDWDEKDGGQLKLYCDTGIEIISPTNQKCVFFKSNELAHEVCKSNAPRMSITGWLKTS